MSDPNAAALAALPPLAPLAAHTRFTEIAPTASLLPPAPRFIFGAMPPAVAAEFFGRSRLPALGIHAGDNLIIGDGLILRHKDGLIHTGDINIQPAFVAQSLAQFGAPDPALPARRLDGPHALITGPGYRIYGHWLADMLPRLAMLEIAGWNLDDLHWLLPDDAPRFAHDILALLGMEAARIVPFGGAAGAVQAQMLLPSYPHNAVRYGSFMQAAAPLLRRRIEARHGALRQGAYPARLFAARRGASRYMAEREATESIFTDAGFTTVRPEQLSILEQWRMFADADCVAGEYGSALHSTLFSPPGTIVAALRGSSFHPAFIQSGLGDRLGHATGYVFGVNQDDETYRFAVAADDVRACVASVFGTASERLVTLQPPPTTADDFIAAHDRLVEEGAWSQAEAAIAEALARAPGHAGAEARRAHLLARAGAPGALKAIRTAIAAGARHPDHFILQAELLLRAGRAQAARATAQDAIALQPDDGEAHDLAAQAALLAGLGAEAVHAARAALAHAPEEPRYALTLHAALRLTGEAAAAASLIADLHARSPRLPGVALAYATILTETGRLAEARAVALAALAFGPPAPGLRALLSALLPPQPALATPPAPDLPVLRGNFDIDFTLRGNSAAHRLAGWGAPESGGIWGIGPQSDVLCPVLDPERDWRAILTLTGFVHPPAVTSQSLTVLANSQEVARTQIAGQATLRIFIPCDLLRPQEMLRLTLLHPDAVSPHALGARDDTRPLAIHCARIRLIPAQKTPAP